jgi:tRNA modification GTPase
MNHPGDTIFAVSTAPGRGAIAVLRVSGARAAEALVVLAGDRLPTPRLATLRQLHGAGGETIDEALVLWFPEPASATGENVAEFHLHGGRAVIQAVLEALARLPGFRPAEAGEFTRRAVENGRLDLTQAEALADLIDAETPSQRRQALGQYDGALTRLYEGWRARIVRLSAHAEAGIDFSDEELPDGLDTQIREGIAALLEEIGRHMEDERSGEITREGLLLTVIGPPNAGKSSLVNALAKRDIAIVSDRPGTTRDVLEARLDLGGYAVTIADTAGLRPSEDAIESEGVRRALARAESGDLTLLLLDGTSPDPFAGLPEEAVASAALVVWNKVDLLTGLADTSTGISSTSPSRGLIATACQRNAPGSDRRPAQGQAPHFGWGADGEGSPRSENPLTISVRTGEGMDTLVETLIGKVRERLDRPREFPLITRARHRHALQHAVDALQRAIAQDQSELIAEELRLALRALGRIAGRVDIEELLDVVFRDFCIGK